MRKIGVRERKGTVRLRGDSFNALTQRIIGHLKGSAAKNAKKNTLSIVGIGMNARAAKERRALEKSKPCNQIFVITQAPSGEGTILMAINADRRDHDIHG